MRSNLIYLSMLALLATVGCSKDKDSASAIPAAAFGTWEVASGDLWPDDSGEFEPIGLATHFELTDAGDGLTSTGTVYAEGTTGVRTCIPLSITRLGGGSIVAAAPAPFEEGESVLKSFLVATDGADALTLTNEKGDEVSLTRVAEIPTSSLCPTLDISATVGLTAPANFRSNLAVDGTTLWFESTGELVPFNTLDGTEGTPVPLGFNFGQYSHAQSTQAGDFWQLCGCGANFNAQRHQPDSTLVDAVNTDLDLGVATHLRGITWDGTHLWMVGSDPDSNGTSSHILQVDTDAEPDVVVATFDYAASVNDATVKDGSVWAIVRNLETSVIEIDIASGRAVRTIVLPADHNWHGLAFVGNTLYVLGLREIDGVNVIVISTP